MRKPDVFSGYRSGTFVENGLSLSITNWKTIYYFQNTNLNKIQSVYQVTVQFSKT